jgi:hypothetical protein
MGKKTKKNVNKGTAESKLKSEVDEPTVVSATVSLAGVGDTVNKKETKDGAVVNIETMSTTENTAAKRVRNPTGLLEVFLKRVQVNFITCMNSFGQS